jgi:hypothetical protein
VVYRPRGRDDELTRVQQLPAGAGALIQGRSKIDIWVDGVSSSGLSAEGSPSVATGGSGQHRGMGITLAALSWIQ